MTLSNVKRPISHRSSSTLRSAVHAILIASALSSVPKIAKAAPDACTNEVFWIRCAGNQSQGVYDEWNTYLQVTDLTQGIAPAAGTRGIVLHRNDYTGPLSLYWDGSQSISTRNATGIFVYNFLEPFLDGRAGNVVVTTNGGSMGVNGFGRYDGILAVSYGQESSLDLPVSGGDVFVDSRTSIWNASTEGNGIFAHSWSTYSGTGGTVRVDTTNARIDVLGLNAHAIFAISDGGYGANGSSGLGGSSGVPGGDGGPVQVFGSGDLFTYNDNAAAILAVSRGGIGGSGGDGWVGNAGNGVFGGSAGTVTVDGSWNIATRGDRSSGIFAESLGGEGGQGGEGYTFGSGGGGGAGGDGGGIVSVGGGGAAGGNGGNVTVTNEGAITASGLNARGIFAQSVGGGGGDGGDAGAIVAVGGAGSGTSDGGRVVVENRGAIASRAHAIYAESVGGGGGTGGSAVGWFSVGGGGGSGGNAAAVTVRNSGSLSTTEDNSSAIFAHSVGGGTLPFAGVALSAVVLLLVSTCVSARRCRFARPARPR